MPPQTEKALQNKIQRYLKKVSAWQHKVTASGYQQNGVPDILACYRGYFLAIEVKSPKGTGKLSKLQAMQIQAIVEAGGMALVADSLSAVEEAIAHIDHMIEVVAAPVT